MRVLSKLFSFTLSGILLLQSAPLLAKKNSWAGVQPPAAFASAQTTDPTARFLQALEKQAFARRPETTVLSLWNQWELQGVVDGHLFTTVFSDADYLRNLSLDEASALAYMAQFVTSTEENPYSRWENILLERVFSQLGEYDEEAADFAEKALYEAVAVSLGHHPRLGRQVEEWAFKQVAQAASRADSARNGWAAVVLADLAIEAESDVWSQARRQNFEFRLENAIRNFDWLKDMPTDYTLRGVKNRLGASNQATLIQLFAQANSFFAMQDDDGFLKQMVSAGGLNPVGRAMMGDENGTPGRFSDTGENFYLHSPTPGTDGEGHFAKTLNGRRHFILSTLVQGLFLSYHTRSVEQSSQLMQQFIRSYFSADAGSHFVHYLYIPLQGMRLGMALHDTSSLYGWEKEEAALQKELYRVLRKGYPWKVVCTGVQGACEVTAEWMALGKVFSWVGRGLGAGAKAVGRQVMKSLPPRAVLYLAVGEIAAQQGKKAVARWSHQSIRFVLQKCGWKGRAAATAGVVGGSTYKRSRSEFAR